MGDEPHEGMSRRTFLQIAGAATAAGCTPARHAEKLVPYLVPPEHIVPGLPLFYRTACRACDAGCGVTARTREGRVIKLEGNPDDPIGRGALCARGQATLQALYAPDRWKGPMRRGGDGKLAAVSWDDAIAALASTLDDERKKGGRGIRMITRGESGSAGAVQKSVLAAFGAGPAQRLVLDPLDAPAIRAASKALYGKDEMPVFDLGAARSVVAFGADFAETWLSPVEMSRQLAAGRGRVGDDRTRFTWVAPRLAMTASSADDWLACRAGGELAIALGLLRWLTDPKNGVGDLAPEAHALAGRLGAITTAEVERRSGVPWARVAALGAELSRRRPSVVLGPGIASAGADATPLAAAIALANHVLGNVGRTVLYGLDAQPDPPSPLGQLRSLVEEMRAGQVRVLLVGHADPAATMPAELRFGEALAKVPMVVTFNALPDGISERAHLVLPDNHSLESFGDLAPRKGVTLLEQPTMTPLADTRSASQVLLDVAAKVGLPEAKLPTDYYEFVQGRGADEAKRIGAADPAAAQRLASEHGGYFSPAAPTTVTLSAGAAEGFLALGAAPSPTEGAFDLVVFPTALRGAGGIDLPWLREVPDGITTINWTGWAEISPATAKLLGVASGDVVAITTPAGRVELPAYVWPGVRDDAVAVPLGGPEAPTLLPFTVDPVSGGLAWRSTSAKLTSAGRRVELPILGPNADEHGREIVRTVSRAHPSLPHPPPPPSMYPAPEYPKHRWAMAIDLDRCTGCQACVVACYAENNVPVMGPEATVRGRNMGWLRIERYFSVGKDGARVDTMPMLCQHCESAPCEPVCPVYATYHTGEGLNAQVYNRCVGTRYCSNNCPYKVRVFNWRDPEFPAPLNLQLNPDVTVRSKGVMEKCTFCVQRIRYAENLARDEGRPVADGEIVPACAQTCPGQAIVFGDAHDPASRVSVLARDGRGYAVLDELNTQPAITYLARVRDDERPEGGEKQPPAPEAPRGPKAGGR